MRSVFWGFGRLLLFQRGEGRKNLHRVADQRRRLQPVLTDETCHVVRHGDVVVTGRVRRFAVVPQVLGVDMDVKTSIPKALWTRNGGVKRLQWHRHVS
jgi:hypothetical protein